MFIENCLPFLTVSGTESDTEENGFGTDLLLLRGEMSLVYLDLDLDDNIRGLGIRDAPLYQYRSLLYIVLKGGGVGGGGGVR